MIELDKKQDKRNVTQIVRWLTHHPRSRRRARQAQSRAAHPPTRP
ncbi:hypothetical protein D7207_30300 [Burkholderia cepacia]|uniref:Uncharacterized protein n=1 Tax=Burkholderia reimsis TaxID=2234132 RepID=A0A365QUH7_9BURK|nr:hypothetical protein [Burkholderia cepacia]MBW5807381.1 hypothetical protein [Burkholderia sp. COPS]RBB38743.1 hypothetical protein DPV79_17445 [Burkholderia reimsis]MBA9947859.1 hypothetical protein [Burkholderia cepacia]MBA9978029.1 hypothetical protein [Burkholderia cepacia]